MLTDTTLRPDKLSEILGLARYLPDATWVIRPASPGTPATSRNTLKSTYPELPSKAAVRREGDDLTVVAIGRMIRPALASAEALAGQGISAEVVDPRTLVPFDEETVLESVARTGHLVVVDEARECCGAASQIAALVAEKGFGSLRGPIQRVTTPNVAIPYAPNAEAQVIPGEARITEAVLSLAGVRA